MRYTINYFRIRYRCLVFPKNVLKGRPMPLGIIQVKRPKNLFDKPNILDNTE